MSCSRYRDTVVLYADGELTGDAAGDVRIHLGGCESCRATFGELERLKEALTPNTSENPTMAETRFWRAFEADLALRVHRVETPFWRRAIVLPVPAAVCMGLAVVALGAIVMNQRSEMDRLAKRTANLEAHLQAEQESVVFASSPRQVESFSLLAERAGQAGTRASEIRRMAAPQPAKVMVPAKGAFELPAPRATPDLPAGMELRFVDSANADFY